MTYSLVQAQIGSLLPLLQLFNLLDKITTPLVCTLEVHECLVERGRLCITDFVVRIEVLEAGRGEASHSRLQVLAALQTLNFFP